MCYHLIGIASDIGWAQLPHTLVFAMQIEPLISWDTAVGKSTVLLRLAQGPICRSFNVESRFALRAIESLDGGNAHVGELHVIVGHWPCRDPNGSSDKLGNAKGEHPSDIHLDYHSTCEGRTYLRHVLKDIPWPFQMFMRGMTWYTDHKKVPTPRCNWACNWPFFGPMVPH